MSDEQKKDKEITADDAVTESEKVSGADPTSEAQQDDAKDNRPGDGNPADTEAARTKKDDVVVESDGKATPSKEAAERALEKQQADPEKQTTSEPSDPPAKEIKEEAADDDKEAKAKAAAEARAARAAARAKKEDESSEPEAPKEPSPNQPRLDRIVALLKEGVAEDAVQEAFINERDRELPMLVIAPEHWVASAELMKENPELKLNYLRNVAGVDQETHMEVVYHLISLETKHEYGVKVKTDREEPSVPSVTPIWSTANWNEREIYDLLGIDFPGHPDLRRIMLTDDWVGHPLRKDYEPIDPEV